MITVIGLVAVLLTAAMLPSQAIHVIRNRDNPEQLSGVSLLTALIVISTSIIWASYGIRFDAIAVSVTAIIDMGFQLLITAIVLRHKRPSPVWLLSILWLGVLVVVATMAPQTALGVIGAGTSMAMFVPQAVRTIRLRGTVSGLAFSPLSALLIVIGNSVWLTYGILLQDVWVCLPCPFSITSGLLILWAWRGSKLALRQAPE